MRRTISARSIFATGIGCPTSGFTGSRSSRCSAAPERIAARRPSARRRNSAKKSTRFSPPISIARSWRATSSTTQKTAASASRRIIGSPALPRPVDTDAYRQTISRISIITERARSVGSPMRSCDTRSCSSTILARLQSRRSYKRASTARGLSLQLEDVHSNESADHAHAQRATRIWHRQYAHRIRRVLADRGRELSPSELASRRAARVRRLPGNRVGVGRHRCHPRSVPLRARRAGARRSECP